MSKISRREFVRLTGLTAAGTVLAACAETPAEPAAPAAPTTAPAAPTVPAEVSRFSEAPQVAEQVQTGTLPPVEERLPVDPMIVPVVEEIGQYGGVWHRVAVGPNDVWTAGRLSYEALVRWDANVTGLYVNLAEAYEVNEDATEYTFRLRRGQRWSDGAPFTADDLMFWYKDGLLNADLTPTFPKRWVAPLSNEPMVLEKLDDETIVFRFSTPYGLFLEVGVTYAMCQWPKHYLSQFHPNYTPAEDLDAKIQDAGFDNWWELFGDRQSWQNTDLPSLTAWHPERVPPEVPSVWERNPYYWKVDPEGNQLPYINAIQFEVTENADLLNMKAVAGEIDMQTRHILWQNYPVFIDNQDIGDYRVLQWTSAEGANTGLMLNQSHKDPVMRQLVQNKDFRIALSLGIDRPAIHELAYQGFGEPRQAALIPQSPYFKPEYPTRWSDHDPDQANEILDQLGLVERDGEGYRLRPDGEPLTITIEYSPIFGPWRDTVQMICDQWQAIGIRGVPKEEDRSLFTQRGRANEHDASIWTIDRCATPLGNPHWFHPHEGGYGWAELYAQWYNSSGRDGEEPPEEIKRQFALYDQMKGATPDELPGLAEQYFDNWHDNLWVIGTVGVLPHLVVVKNKFRNVPEDAVSDVRQNTPANTNVEQYFWKQE